MGFGHRVYRNYDPRARIIRKYLDDVFEVRGKSPLLEVATELEKRALDDEYFTSRKLYPNVDFYSGLIYEALGLPVAMFPVMFAIGRTSGWIAQWKEMVEDAEQKIARPAPDLHGRPRSRLRADRGSLAARSHGAGRRPRRARVRSTPRSLRPSPAWPARRLDAAATARASRREGAASRDPRDSQASGAPPATRSGVSGRGAPGGRPRARRRIRAPAREPAAAAN